MEHEVQAIRKWLDQMEQKSWSLGVCLSQVLFQLEKICGEQYRKCRQEGNGGEVWIWYWRREAIMHARLIVKACYWPMESKRARGGKGVEEEGQEDSHQAAPAGLGKEAQHPGQRERQNLQPEEGPPGTSQQGRS